MTEGPQILLVPFKTSFWVSICKIIDVSYNNNVEILKDGKNCSSMEDFNIFKSQLVGEEFLCYRVGMRLKTAIKTEN
jgi:hypothetical protein